MSLKINGLQAQKGEKKWLLKLDLQEWEIKSHLFIV